MVKMFQSNKYKKGTRVWVEGDSSVGMSGFHGYIESDDGVMVGVRDDDGDYDEYPKRYVWSDKELKDRDKEWSKLLKKK